MATTTHHKIETEETTLALKPQGENFAIYWPVNSRGNFEAIFSVCQSRSLPPDTKTVIYTEESPENKSCTLEEAMFYTEKETPLFLRVFTDDFSLTWEYKSDPNLEIVGLISSSGNENLINVLYSESFHSELPREAQERISSLLNNS